MLGAFEPSSVLTHINRIALHIWFLTSHQPLECYGCGRDRSFVVGKWMRPDKVFSWWRLLTVEYFCRRNYLCCAYVWGAVWTEEPLLHVIWWKLGTSVGDCWAQHAGKSWGCLYDAMRGLLEANVWWVFPKQPRVAKPTQLLQPLLSCLAGPYLTKVLSGIVRTAAILSLNKF